MCLNLRLAPDKFSLRLCNKRCKEEEFKLSLFAEAQKGWTSLQLFVSHHNHQRRIKHDLF